MNLSDSVYGATSIAAIGVAAHECGHAIQDADSYAPLKIRGALVPVANFGATLSWPLIIPVSYTHLDVYKRQAQMNRWIYCG